MKNGLSVRLPLRGAPEDAEAPRVFHRLRLRPVPWSTRARCALGPSACRGGGAAPLHVP